MPSGVVRGPQSETWTEFVHIKPTDQMKKGGLASILLSDSDVALERSPLDFAPVNRSARGVVAKHNKNVGYCGKYQR